MHIGCTARAYFCRIKTKTVHYEYTDTHLEDETFCLMQNKGTNAPILML